MVLSTVLLEMGWSRKLVSGAPCLCKIKKEPTCTFSFGTQLYTLNTVNVGAQCSIVQAKNNYTLFRAQANEPEIYLKAGRFADHSWSHGDDSGLEETFADSQRIHQVISRSKSFTNSL